MIEGRASYNKDVVLRGKLVAIPQIDVTLTKAGHSAEAKAVGEKIAWLTRRLDASDPGVASGVDYDNSTSGLQAKKVQGAIDEVNALLKALSEDALRMSKSGMMKGTFMVQNADNGYGSFMKNNSATADYGTQMADVSKDGKTAKVTVNAISNLLTFTDNGSNIRNVYHEGNKQFGSYQGNGSETQRIINTNSIGRLLLVYNTQYFSFVTPEGAYVRNLVDGTDRWIESQKSFYINGKLTLSTTNAAFNTNGTTYHYQAL